MKKKDRPKLNPEFYSESEYKEWSIWTLVIVPWIIAIIFVVAIAYLLF